MLKVLYFASLRERMGRDEEEIPLPPDVATVGQLLLHLRNRDTAGARALAQTATVRAAVNQEFASIDTALRDGDEVAFFPPVTGG